MRGHARTAIRQTEEDNVDTVNDTTELESLPVEQLVEMIRERTGAGVNLSFPGKVLGPVLG